MWLILLAVAAVAAAAWGLRLRQESDRLALALRRSEERLKAVVSGLPVGLLVHGSKKEILECNPAAVAILGLPEAQLRGKTWSDPEWNVIDEDASSVPGQEHPVARAMATRQPVRNVVMGVQRPATWDRLWLIVNAEPELDADGKVARVVCFLVDVTVRKRLEGQILDQTLRDPLTGCFNRRYLDEFEKRALARQRQWGCVVVDIAGLKQYNERHGHLAGDDVIMRMSRFLMLQVRAGEAVVRLAGDEFLALLTGVDKTTIEHVVQRILREAMRQAPISFSMGWAAREGDEPLEKTIGRAEEGPVTVPVAERADLRRLGPGVPPEAPLHPERAR